MKYATDDSAIVKDEAVNSLNSGPTTRWSFSPMQAIPRNAEALWNLIDTVYFGVIPSGHELLECLKALSERPPSVDRMQGPLMGPCARFSYKTAGGSASVEKTGGFKIDFVIENGAVAGIVSANISLPPVPAPSRRLVKGKDSSLETQEEERKWELVDSVWEESLEGANTAELRYLEQELGRLQKERQSRVFGILEKINADSRPNKKAWFEAEQNLLALYERKPPSSFMASSISSSSSSSAHASAPPPLSKLGKVDAELPDSFKDAELCCCVCGEGDTTEDNDILICDGCLFAAHQSCYFVKEIPDGHWFCQLCSASKGGGSRRLAAVASTPCCLCLQSGDCIGGGLMKPVATNNGSVWAHVKCALWVPEAAFPGDGLSISFVANPDRENLRCSICKLKGGAPLQCAFGKCTTAFHVSCAARMGFLPEEKSLKNLYCARHVKIQLQTSPSISRLLSVRKQDFYLKVVNDKLQAPKIGGALVSSNFDAKIDAQQAFFLQIASVQPLVLAALAPSRTGFVGPADLMDPGPTLGPLMKEISDLTFPTGEEIEAKKNFFLDLACCSECMRPIEVRETEDAAFKCDSCGLFCHSLCYERAGVPAPNTDDLTSSVLKKIIKWPSSSSPSRRKVCARCEQLSAGLAMAQSYCVLCMQIGGLVVPLERDEEEDRENEHDVKNTFIHPRCLWWMLASSMVSLSEKPCMQIKSISSSYHFHACAVCGSRLGCTVKCGRVGCGRRFHVSCGFHAGCFFTVRTSNGVVAGTRDPGIEQDESFVLENLSAALNGESPFRRVITCWSHEQRGMRRVAPQLGRGFPHRVERITWVPEGIRPELITIVNQVLSGEDLGGATASPPFAEPKKLVSSESATRRRKRRKKELEEEELAKAKVQTVRFVDGMEVTCQDEDWEGGCALCGKAWTDSRGQILESICCDKCDQWFHFACVGISKAPSGDFICPNCL